MHLWRMKVRKHRCNILYSEDMQHNQIIEGLKIINPFKESE